MNIVSWKLICVHRLKCSDCWVCCIGWRRVENGKTSFDVKLKKYIYIYIFIYFNLGKLHFITINYALDYTLQPKLFKHILCTLNYHTYNTLHPGVTFAVMLNRMLLHMTSTCFLLRWNKLKRLKHPTSKPIKTKPNFFHISLPFSRACSLFPKSRFF